MNDEVTNLVDQSVLGQPAEEVKPVVAFVQDESHIGQEAVAQDQQPA